ncbi:MAG: NAD-dependent dihydropyrimidine dehydrogenase subunit PreA [Treponema sp.]|nr:NAD-dependent dihydropyrimidine dehydrogenase subunit PreA [Treponema sp.]
MVDNKYASVFIREAVSSCLLCKNVPCTSACKKNIDCAKVVTSLRFDNMSGARAQMVDNTACVVCTSFDCMKACLKAKIDDAVPIYDIMGVLKNMEDDSSAFENGTTGAVGDVSLEVSFCGVQCENPFFLSSSVVASDYDMLARAFEAGWAGAAFKTIGTFVPEEVSPRFSTIRKESNTFIGLKNIEQISDHTLDENLSCIRRLKKNYPSKIIIASIMGQSVEEWELLARKVEDAGADIIECNFSCPHMAASGLGSDVGQSPELVAGYTAAVKKASKLPVLAKMTPNLGHIEIPALAAVKAGADGIAAINTIKSIMNVNLQSFASSPDVSGFTSVGGYSGKAVKPIALRFINDIKQNNEMKDIPVSGMGGIETWQDAAEFMALGCGTVQITTAVMQYGYGIIYDMIDGMKRYLAKNNYTDVSQIIGRAVPKIVSADRLDRSSTCYPKFLHNTCVGCGRCVISCSDGGHQALTIGSKAEDRPVMNAKKCVGCQLCMLVCPVGAIVSGSRVKNK